MYTKTIAGDIDHKVFNCGKHTIVAPVKIKWVSASEAVGKSRVAPAVDEYGRYLWAWPGGLTVTEDGELWAGN